MNLSVTTATSGSIFFLFPTPKHWTIDPEEEGNNNHNVHLTSDPSPVCIFVLQPISEFQFKIVVVDPSGRRYLTRGGGALLATSDPIEAVLFTWDTTTALAKLRTQTRSGSTMFEVAKRGNSVAVVEGVGDAIGFTTVVSPGNERLSYFLCDTAFSSGKMESDLVSISMGNRTSSSSTSLVARKDVEKGMVLFTEQHAVFDVVIGSGSPIKQKSSSSPCNAVVTDVLLGVPGRTFTFTIVIATESLKKGETIRTRYIETASSANTMNLAVAPFFPKEPMWPPRDDYYHGGGYHNVGPCYLVEPYNSLAMKECTKLGTGQYEVVATRLIPQGTAYCYGGDQAKQHGPYLWQDSNNVTTAGGNILRYINAHYGFNSEPNVEFVEVPYYITKDVVIPVLCVVALRDIRPGESVLVGSYGKYYDYVLLRRAMQQQQPLCPYPPFRDTQKHLLLPHLTSIADWVEEGDIGVLVDRNRKKSSLQIIKFDEVHAPGTKPSTGKMFTPPTSGVQYILHKNAPTIKFDLLDCVLLIPGEDYEVEDVKPSKSSPDMIVAISQCAHCLLLDTYTAKRKRVDVEII